MKRNSVTPPRIVAIRRTLSYGSRFRFAILGLEDGKECDGTLASPSSPPLMSRTLFLLFKGRCVPLRAHTTVTDKDLRRVQLSGADVIRGDAERVDMSLILGAPRFASVQPKGERRRRRLGEPATATGRAERRRRFSRTKRTEERERKREKELAYGRRQRDVFATEPAASVLY